MVQGSIVPRIESSDLSLTDLFKDFYTVPDFQREFVWKAEHVEKLLQDVYDEFYDEQGALLEGPEYFIGSIVACADGKGAYQLIDGQQRLTTIYLVVCAVRDVLKAADEQENQAIASLIRDVSADRVTMKAIVRYRLALQYEDSHDVLERIADGGELASGGQQPTESMRNLVGAYAAVREFLRLTLDDDPVRVNRFLAAFLNRVKLIRVVTPSLAHALKVFETINDRGIGLNPMDLLKNLLFMQVESADYPKLKTLWKQLTDEINKAKEKPLRFLRYYVMSHHKIDARRGIREDEIYSWLVEHRKECGLDTAPLRFAAELVECSRAYRNFLDGCDPEGNAVPYLANISKLAGGAVRQHLILALAGRHLTKQLFAELCRNLENLFFCYVITREPTKVFERAFARWAPRLRRVTTPKDLQAFVREEFYKDMSARVSAFDFAFDELTQDKIQQYRLRYILAKLTQHVEQEAWDNAAHATLEQFMGPSVHVEHVLPQTPGKGVRESFDLPSEYDAHVGRLGNLMLLEKTINTSVSNGSYKQKRDGYAESAFLLTKSTVAKPVVGKNTAFNRAIKGLRQFPTWDSETINARQQMLKGLAHAIWLADVEG